MRAALKAKRDAIQSEIAEHRKALRKVIKIKDFAAINKIESKIENLEREKRFYDSKVLPVQFENGFVLNGKLLEEFVKRLPRTYLEAEFSAEDNAIYIRHSKGCITLYNLSDYYQGFKMPKGEDLLAKLGITLKEV